MNYELHPLCTLFPRMADAEFNALVQDIATNGLRQPIVLHEKMILDGGNRYRACIAAEVEPDFIEHDGGNLVSFVLSANMHRRHMTPGQQAAIVASAQDWAKAQPASRPEKAGNLAGLSKAGNLAGLSTVADRASQSGAGERTQRMADKVAKADPELAKQVAHGDISLPQAVEKITGKRPGKPTPDTKPVQPAPDADMHAEMVADAMDALREENESLRNQIAAMLFTGTDEEKAEYLDRLNHLTAENKRLEIMNRGLTEARDRVMRENVSLRKQGEYAARKLKAIDRAAA